VKNIITIQHTQSVQHTNGMIGSWTDWELTDLGKLQAQSIGRKLAAEIIGKPYKIYCSDLLRAKQTAEPLARYMGISIEFCEKLREINYGEAVGKSKLWAKENKLLVRSFDDPEYPHAESWRAFWNRVMNLFNEIIADKAENIILVSHAGTLKVLQEILIYSELQEYTKYGSAGSVSFMEIKDNGERIIKRLNDLSYIEGVTI